MTERSINGTPSGPIPGMTSGMTPSGLNGQPGSIGFIGLNGTSGLNGTQPLFPEPNRLITGRRDQTAPFQPVERGLCKSFVCTATTPQAQCEANEWTVGMRNCGISCPQQPICSKVDPSVCPIIGGQPAVSATFDQPPVVACTYSPSQFKTAEDLVRWSISFPNQTQVYNSELMPTFCARQSASCPEGATGRCSIMRANTEEGRMCREWALSNPQLANQSVSRYCDQFNGPDCKCFKREADLEFRSFNQYLEPNTPASCWYRACTASNQLIPLEMREPVCPTDTCARIQKGWTDEQKNHLSPSVAAAATICPLNGTNPTNPTSGSSTWWFWLLLGLAILIGIGIILFFVFRSRKDDSIRENEAEYVPRPVYVPVAAPVVPPMVVAAPVVARRKRQRSLNDEILPGPPIRVSPPRSPGGTEYI